MTGYWAGRSRLVIEDCFEKYCDNLDDKPFDYKYFKKHLSSNYPFGVKENYPYQAWLGSVKTFTTQLLSYLFSNSNSVDDFDVDWDWKPESKTKKSNSKPIIPKVVYINPNQLTLFNQ